MRIDAHQHFWELARRPQPWLDGPETTRIRRDFTPEDLAPETKGAGIDKTILVQVLPDVTETREFLATAAATELVAGVVGWADLTDPQLPETLASLCEGPGGELLVGIRHLVQGEPDDDWLNRPDVRRGLGAVAETGLAYDLLTLPRQLPAAITTARALSDLTFVLDHLSKPAIATGELEPWASLIGELAAEPNVFCKLSGMVTEAKKQWRIEDLRPYTEVVIEAYGPKRIMFGSDWPVCLLQASYAEVVSAGEELTRHLTAAETAEIFGGTAHRAYRLGKRGS
ncbi:amidohydrolase family protein [Nonomuraea sp. bgisy101]|uniref:amidohydrolase family protein n=1 Tax=Nonomuraea sp. bgisy101 TaxID=3413784 RepID=UPI003D74B77F